jgi:hypothetical protein
MRTSWKKIAEYVGTSHGQDISNELQNKITVIIPEPTHAPAILTQNVARETVIRAGQNNLQLARRAGEAILQAAATAGQDPRAPMELAILQNETATGQLELTEPVPLQLTDPEKTQYSNDWRTYQEPNANLAEH